jgi:hypothetical protein
MQGITGSFNVAHLNNPCLLQVFYARGHRDLKKIPGVDFFPKTTIQGLI